MLDIGAAMAAAPAAPRFIRAYVLGPMFDGGSALPMRALSMRQPWAWLTVSGLKEVENRTWPTRLRERIYVHAGRSVKPDDYPPLRDYIRQTGIAIPADLPRGALVGEVTITDCVGFSDNPWFCGPYGFLLTEPLLYHHPIPWPGKLGFFPV